MSKVTELICIIDRSGSMSMIKEDAMGGFNTFIEEQKKLDGEARITVALFNDGYELLANSVDLKKFEGLDDSNFKPMGMTALLDAIGKTVSVVDNGVGIMPEEKDYIVAILTDGMENMSKEYNRDTINKIIEEKTELGWQFIYLGANQDAIREARNLGIDSKYAGTFATANGGTKAAVLHMNEMVVSYRDAGVMTSYVEAVTKVNEVTE